MKEHIGENPQNARIKIKYSDNKPKVSFSYPVNKKDTKTNVNLFLPIFFCFILLNLPLLFYLTTTDAFSEERDYNSSKEYNISNYKEFLKYYNQEERIKSTYESLNENWFEIIFDRERIRALIFFSYLIGTPFIIYLPFKKRWDKHAPDFEAFMTRKRYKKFDKGDLKITKEGRYYIELPIFNNIVCDFNATKYFSKYLDEFEIEEYKFEYYKKKRSKLNKKKQRPKNEIIWYARWYFLNKPTKGELEVIFK